MATDIQSVVWKFYNNAIARTTYADTPSAVYEYLGRLGFTKPGVTNRWKDAAASINYQYRGDIDMQNKVALGTISVAPINALFVNNEQGLWYDPSQFDTMFQDSAGTTPVTAAGDLVGLILDKRLWRGQTLAQVIAGRPEICTGGTFDSVTGWNLLPGTTVSGGKLNVNSASGANYFDGSGPAGWYLMTFTIDSRVAGDVIMRLLSGASNVTSTLSTYRSAAGTYTVIAYASGSFDRVALQCGGGGFNGVIDNVSVKLIPGNHASQATSAARPVLARVPFGGRRNLLIRTEDYSTGWTLTNASGGASRNGNVLTFGANALDRFVQSNVALAAAQHTGSIVLSGTGAVRLYMIGGDGTTGTPTDVTLTSTPTRYSVTRTPAGSGSGGGIGIYNNAGASPSTVTIDQAQLETGAAFTAYQKVTSTHDVTEAGKADCWHLSFDGSDDGMATGSSDFSGGDEIMVTAGVRKNSDASRGMVVELGPDVTNAFLLAAPNVNANTTYTFVSRGSGTQRVANSGTFAAPITNVLTGRGKISAPSSNLRVDGVSQATDTNTQGTGNYANAAVYIGRRGGSSLPFNGHCYGLVVRAGLPDAGQLVAVEQYMAGKTGVSF